MGVDQPNQRKFCDQGASLQFPDRIADAELARYRFPRAGIGLSPAADRSHAIQVPATLEPHDDWCPMTDRVSVQSAGDAASNEVWVRVAEPDYADIREFLFCEAELLDTRRYDKWFALLAPEIEYRVVARVVRSTATEPQEFLVLDDRQIDIKTRIDQISNPKLTFAENPAPFTRRLVSNIRATSNSTSDVFSVESYLLMYRKDASVPEPYLISVVRRDLVRRVVGGLQLVKRHVQLDQSVIASANLATIL